jgi:C-terminal processing protease CtpA/Prc
LYVLVTGSSASASESLICGLRPYMEVILVGEQTSGKYCAGYMFDAEKWYDAVKDSLDEGEYEKALPRIRNWGMYIMYSRYADCNGVTLSMPDGIAPDYGAEDDPSDGFDLGDPQETMLAFALGLIEGRTPSVSGTRSSEATISQIPFHKPGFGVLVAN